MGRSNWSIGERGATAIRTLLPIAIGLCVAGAIIGVLSAGARYIQRYPLSRRQLSSDFALMSALSGAWCALFGVRAASRWQAFALIGMVALSATFAWAAIGTAEEWPGFRQDTDRDVIEEGVHDDELDGE